MFFHEKVILEPSEGDYAIDLAELSVLAFEIGLKLVVVGGNGRVLVNEEGDVQEEELG